MESNGITSKANGEKRAWKHSRGISRHKKLLDTRPPSIAIDAEGKLTGNAQLTGRMLTLKWVEILLLSGYLESGLGFEGANHNFLIDLEFITRGGKVPFILGLDANEVPEAWLKVAWGEKDFLAHMQADIVVARNSSITCTGAQNAEGGRNIDYFIVSYVLLGMLMDCWADFQVPFSPHFGLVLKLRADPTQIFTRALVQPEMPKAIAKYDSNMLEENSFQKTAKPANKVQHQKLQTAKKEELYLRQLNDGEKWQKIFEKTPHQELDFNVDHEVSQHVKKHFESMTGQNAEECLLSKNLSRWATAVQHFWFDKCGEDFSKVQNLMGKLPQIETKPVVKAKLGDLRQMVLPGGGDVCTRVWASMKVKTEALRKWMQKGAYRTAAAEDAILRLEQFMVGEGQLFEHVWKDVEPKLALRIKVEIVF